MQESINKNQLEAWNGYEGEHWARNQERYDAVNAGANEPLFRAAGVQPGEHVLDVGCGSGQTTRLAARAARGGYVTGIDLSEPMLERARITAEAEGIANVDFIQGDAQVYSFPEGTYDVAISRFGVMFFDGAVAAFTNIGRGLCPGGRFAFVCLRNMMGDGNEMMIPFMAALRDAPKPASVPNDNGSGADSLADPDHTREVLREAGFVDVLVEPLQVLMTFGTDPDDAAEFILGWGPVHYNLQQAGVTDTEPARLAVVEALRPFAHADGVKLRSDVWLVSAARPR